MAIPIRAIILGVTCVIAVVAAVIHFTKTTPPPAAAAVGGAEDPSEQEQDIQEDPVSSSGHELNLSPPAYSQETIDQSQSMARLTKVDVLEENCAVEKAERERQDQERLDLIHHLEERLDVEHLMTVRLEQEFQNQRQAQQDWRVRFEQAQQNWMVGVEQATQRRLQLHHDQQSYKFLRLARNVVDSIMFRAFVSAASLSLFLSEISGPGTRSILGSFLSGHDDDQEASSGSSIASSTHDEDTGSGAEIREQDAIESDAAYDEDDEAQV